MHRVLIVAILVFCAGSVISGQDEPSSWDVPEEARAVQNPVENTPDAVASGKGLYEKHCKMCHGDAGKGDGAATQFIKPAPPDVTTAEARDRLTDGEIFYKITTGKRPMPSMERKLDETERWQVVHFLRTLQAS